MLLSSSIVYRVLHLVQLFLVVSLARSILLLSQQRLSETERTYSAGEIEAFGEDLHCKVITDEGVLPICVQACDQNRLW